MGNMPDNYIDFVITSPPYDDIRNYNGYQFEFKKIAYNHPAIFPEKLVADQINT